MTDVELKVDDLTIRYGERSFLYRFALSGHGLVAVTGASGSGKSTLFHLLAGFETPMSGRALLNGVDLTASPPGQRDLTYIFQDHNLFAHLDVFTNVALGLSPTLTLTGEDRARIEAALADVGLAGFSRRMPQALSGGERQRVAFARALVRNRPLLLLDEPFASLDPELRHEMGDLLAELISEQKALALMVTHDREEVSRRADRVIEIEAGQVVFCGATASWPKRRKSN